MKKLPLAVLGFIGLYLFFTIVMIPASFVVGLVQLPAGLSYRSIEGSAWNIRLKQVSYQGLTFSQVNVQPNLLNSLVNFAPSLTFSLGGRTDAVQASGEALVGKEIKSLTDANLLVPANTVVNYAKLPMPVDAKGDVQFTITQLTQGLQGCTELDGQIKWPNARLDVMNEKLSIGDIQAKLSCERGEIVVSIDDSQKLGLVFTLKIAQSGTYYGEGFFKPTSQTPEQISQLLPMMGRADAQGRYPLRL